MTRAPSPLSLLDRAERCLLVWTILGLALVGFVQVIARYVFNYSFTWFEEAGRYAGVLLTFLGAAIGVKTGSHFTMDLIARRLTPRWRQPLEAANNLLCSLFFLAVCWYSVRLLLRMYGFGTTSPAMGLPMYMVYLPIPFFSLVIAWRFLARAWRQMRSPGAELR